MKKNFLIAAIILLAACTENNHSVRTDDLVVEPVEIDTLKVPERMLNEIYYLEEESYFPQIRGLSDSVFMQQLNALVLENFERFSKSAKTESGLFSKEEIEQAELMNSTPASCNARFEILSKNDSLISIAQYFTSRVGHGGNAWAPGSAVLNIDVINRRLLKNRLPDFPSLNFEKLNERVVQYFKNIYPSKGDFSGLQEYQVTPEKLQFAIRNDSLVLVLEAYPGAHSSYGTYLIPIDKCTYPASFHQP